MASLLEDSGNYELCVSLSELGFKKDVFSDFDYRRINKDSFFNLIFCSPVESTDVSHYGLKFSKITSINRKSRDIFFKEIMDEMEVDSVNLFNVYHSEPDKNGNIKERTDLRQKLFHEETSFIYLYTGSSQCEIALFSSIRNALAHGNVFVHNNFLYLYSVSSQNNKTVDEFDRQLTFILRLNKLESLDRLWSVLCKYSQTIKQSNNLADVL